MIFIGEVLKLIVAVAVVVVAITMYDRWKEKKKDRIDQGR